MFLTVDVDELTEYAEDCHLVKLGTMGKYGTPNIDIEEGSEGIQCPTTDSSRNCVIGAEPGMAVSGHPPSPVREALFNTLRKDVHRGQKDSVIGT
ncbi:hypothetical protein CTI12_AA317790 [Artemisia annua]|uniref:Uncharacterized protein n=1 Tax=Artemisia annua TaxID=35608 RepID=A0A2U1N1X7_ARTAN|nr:hypothetical protein CTI12_AA317790 [Artemisia annua]